jgi:hypothetical protein
MKIYDHEHPRNMPIVNRDYNPALRRWDHPPPPWIWGYRAEPVYSKWDAVAGIFGVLIVAMFTWWFVLWAF